MLPPIIRTIQVSCHQELAFNVFISEMDSWWPLSKFTVSAMNGKTAKRIHVETFPGGNIIEIDSEDNKHLWGSIKEYNPYNFLSMNFHIPTLNEIVNERSIVELTFTEINKNKTNVELKQSNWEAFGERAKDLQGGYGGGWTVIFENAYMQACNR